MKSFAQHTLAYPMETGHLTLCDQRPHVTKVRVGQILGDYAKVAADTGSAYQSTIS